VLQLPGGTEHLTVLDVCYERVSVEPFREPPGSEASAMRLPRRRLIYLTKRDETAQVVQERRPS
jgi:transcription elongation factor GreB